MAPKFSLRKFLKTGRLGPVQVGMTMMDLARVLGPPGGWILQPDEAVPTYWVYGHLEILFALDAPHEIRWFQLEHAEYLKGDGPFLGEKDFDLDLDGLHGRMRPSDLLRSRIWKAAEVGVTIESKVGRSLAIVHSGVQVIFDLSNADHAGEALLDHAIEHGTIGELVRACDRCARLDSIYSYPVEQLQEGPRDAVCMDGSRYLRLTD